MKETVIKGLQVLRKMGFVMAVIMIFPYVSNFPAVLASDGASILEPHEVSIEDLELEYEKQAIQDQCIQDFEEEYSKYILINENGEIEIDYLIRDFISEDELKMIEGNIAFINTHINEGTGYLDEDGSLIVTEIYDDFVLQAGTTKVNKIRWNYIDFDLSSYDAKFFKVLSVVYVGAIAIYGTAIRQAGVSVTKGIFQTIKLIVAALKGAGSIASIIKSLVTPVISLIILTIAFIIGKFCWKFAEHAKKDDLSYGVNVYWKFLGRNEFEVTRL